MRRTVELPPRIWSTPSSAQPVGAVQRLSLPGQTAAWHSSTIYARVNGYVGKWFVDIGDHVHKGQVMALIETPDLDAQLAGCPRPAAGRRGAGARTKARRGIQQVHLRALA